MKQPRQFASAPRLLEHGGSCLILGSGPSLKQSDVDFARQFCPIQIAINDSYVMLPDATALYFGDVKWITWHQGASAPHVHNGKKYPAFVGRYKVSIQAVMPHPYRDVLILRQAGGKGLSLDPARLATGKQSGHAAINLAVHFGATRIILLGIDLKPGTVVRDGVKRQSDHFAWMGRHQDDTKPPYEIAVPLMRTLVEPLKQLNVSVVNCSPNSALDCFPKMTLAEAFAHEAPHSDSDVARSLAG